DDVAPLKRTVTDRAERGSRQAPSLPLSALQPLPRGRLLCLLVLLVLLALAVGLWVRAPLRQYALSRQPLTDLAAYLDAHPSDAERAEAELQRAVTLDPDHAGARLELARGALAERHYGEALRHLDRVIRNDPKNVEALEALSTAHRSLGNLDQAEAYAREAVR